MIVRCFVLYKAEQEVGSKVKMGYDMFLLFRTGRTHLYTHFDIYHRHLIISLLLYLVREETERREREIERDRWWCMRYRVYNILLFPREERKKQRTN